MITDAHPGTPTQMTIEPASREEEARPRGAGRRPLWPWLAAAALAAGVAASNVWWYWRDTRPVASLKTIVTWLAREQFAQAEDALREHLRRSPHHGEARILLARALAGRGDLAPCARELHEVPPWWPTKADALLREGQAYLMIDRAKDAEAAWLAVVEDDPLHPRPHDIFHDASLELLKLYSTEDRWEDAFVILWNAYDRAAPADLPTLLSMRLRSEMERVAPEETVPRLERYVAADPTDWEALRALARAEQSLDRPAEARRHFEACLKGQPENPRVWRDYLDCAARAGRHGRVGRVAGRGPPGGAERGRDLAVPRPAQGEGRRLDRAAEDYGAALRLNPYILAHHYRLAMVEERLGHREEAAEHRRQAESLPRRGASSCGPRSTISSRPGNWATRADRV